jgi:hypothetical protein
MKDIEIHTLWEQFITDYKQYVDVDTIKVWKDKLNMVKQYIDINKKRPSEKDKNTDIKQLGKWICHQKENYNSDIKECKNIMKDVEIHTLWEQFISTYKEYIVVDTIEAWKDKLNQVKQYIDINKKSPSTIDKNIDIKKLGTWICHQKKNYNSNIKECKQIMKDIEIHTLWTQFISTYKQYVDVDFNKLWKDKLNIVKQYIYVNNKTPSYSDKNVDVKKLGQWICDQKKNYNSDIKKCKCIMKDIEIHTLWKQFITDYKQFFCKEKSVAIIV